MTNLKEALFNLVPLALLLLAGSVQAAGHNDSGAIDNDPLAEIHHLYAFLNPICRAVDDPGCTGDPVELILALTVNPFATGATQFSDAVVYHFYIENDSGATSRIDCSFSREQVVTCAGLGGLSVQARVGEIGSNGDLRVFAGLRDDPFFFDLQAFEEFQEIGLSAFKFPGFDFFAGANTLALVIGIKIGAIPPESGASTNLQKIWAATERTAGDGINGAISGSWYNPLQSGQGWVIEVVSSSSGEDHFVVYFYGYDNNGEQLWLLGSGPGIEGNSVTVAMVRTSGNGFGHDFNPGELTMEPVGSMTFYFTDCNSATVVFTPGNGSLSAFSTNMVRLTNISSLRCSLLSSGQIDRAGRPLVSDFLISEPMKDAYNTESNPDRWADLFSGEILGGIEALDLADGIAGNLFTGDPQMLAGIFVDDRLQIDLKKSNCTEYGSNELASLVSEPADSCGGRALFYDVVDGTLGFIVSGFDPDVSDYVDVNDVEFLSEFPFLAPPHGPANQHAVDWEVSTPAEQGLDPSNVQSLYKNAGQIDYLYSLLLVKNGYLIAEEYYNGQKPGDANPIASVTKSFMSALIGIALRENVLTSLDQKMVDFFPEIDWENHDPRKSDITIRQILQMRSGYPWEEFSGDLETLLNSSNWIGLLEEFPLASAPGTRFGYSNLTAHMTSIILERAAGMSPLTFAKTHLFGPLGASIRHWPSDAAGHYYGSGGMYVTPRDLAKFGHLYLDDGVFKGRRILPASWVSESLQPYSYDTYDGKILSHFNLLDYGYLWWSSSAGSHAFNYAWGHGGQLIIVLHDLDMIIVTTTAPETQFGNVAWRKEKAVMELAGEFISSIP